MASRVQYKFKSATTSETVVFEGMYLSVGDLKREIVEKKGLSRDHAAELLLSEAQTGRGTRQLCWPPPAPP
jgi:E3 ubiquitin-protein ligase RBBP6